MILQGLKPCIFKRLEKFKARWVVELPSVPSGAYKLPPRAALATHLSSWSMGRRQSSRLTSTTEAQECCHTRI
jgi:hypothetical protein